MHFISTSFTETRDKNLVTFYEPQYSSVIILIFYSHCLKLLLCRCCIIIPIVITINVISIRVVFKWLMRGFSGHLLPEQLLNLWDMIIAYDSLEVLPLLAVAILSFRKDNLLQVNTLQNVDVSTRTTRQKYII